MYSGYWKPVIIVYKVINMDIFHTKSIGLPELLEPYGLFL